MSFEKAAQLLHIIHNSLNVPGTDAIRANAMAELAELEKDHAAIMADRQKAAQEAAEKEAAKQVPEAKPIPSSQVSSGLLKKGLDNGA